MSAQHTAGTPAAAIQLGSLPIVRARGTAREIGEQYGAQARTRILRCLEEYAAVYRKFAGWEWDRVRVEAEAFVDAIEAFSPESLEQIRGIAAGSGLDTLDVLGMNLRTEILFAGQARTAARDSAPPGECSIFTFVEPDSGRRFSAQNWDWIPFAADTVVLLEVEEADGLRYATVVEAGILAKFGLNSHGLALTTNALVSARDRGEPGVPYHVMLHALIRSRSLAEARELLSGSVRSSSASYLMVDETGAAFGAETRPGTAADIVWNDASSCELTHTNHFMHDPDPLASDDLAARLMPDSRHRLDRVHDQLLTSAQPGILSVPAAKSLMSDHAGYPDSVCCHPNPAEHPLSQGLTVSAAIIDPAARTMEVTAQTPCVGDWHTLDYRTAWGETRS